MPLQYFKQNLRAIILGITSVIIFMLLFRIVIDLFNASNSNDLVLWFRNLTDGLMEPFVNIIPKQVPNEFRGFNYLALVTIGIYLIIGIIISEFITAFIQPNVKEVIISFVDAIFKIIEFILVLRILFDLFQVKNAEGFVGVIYSLSSAVNGLISFTLLNGRINVGLIIVLIFVVLFDYLTERFLDSAFSFLETPTAVRSVQSPKPQIYNTYNTTYYPTQPAAQPAAQQNYFRNNTFVNPVAVRKPSLLERIRNSFRS